MAVTYVVDFDDLYDEIADRALTHLLEVKTKYPNFKCTLFTIPNRTSKETILKYKEHSWIALAIHGWHHTKGECLTWPYHEAMAKISEAQDMGIDAPAFRAPNWLINRATYEVCRDKNLVVCDHKDNYLGVLDSKVYRYNDPIWRAPKIRPIHGHLTNCAVDNYIGDMLKDGRLTFAKEANFIFPWDTYKIVTKDTGEDI